MSEGENITIMEAMQDLLDKADNYYLAWDGEMLAMSDPTLPNKVVWQFVKTRLSKLAKG